MNKIEILEFKTKVRELQKEVIDLFKQKRDHSFDAFYNKDKIELFTKEFINMFPQKPVKDNTGGGGLIPNYWLFMISKLLAPELIIESGVWKGQTSWLLRQGQPAAEIHSFDTNLNNRQYIDESIHYHECDWAKSVLENCYGDKAMIFFDDHINQAKRVKEAYKREFKWIVFDDNVPVNLIHRIGLPPLPNISMLFDENMKIGDIITWELNGVEHSYTYRKNDMYGVRELIEFYIIFPTPTYLTLVKLK